MWDKAIAATGLSLGDTSKRGRGGVEVGVDEGRVAPVRLDEEWLAMPAVRTHSNGTEANCDLACAGGDALSVDCLVRLPGVVTQSPIARRPEPYQPIWSGVDREDHPGPLAVGPAVSARQRLDQGAITTGSSFDICGDLDAHQMGRVRLPPLSHEPWAIWSPWTSPRSVACQLRRARCRWRTCCHVAIGCPSRVFSTIRAFMHAPKIVHAR